MLGGRTGHHHSRAGSAQPRLVEFPSDEELQRMSQAQLERTQFTHVDWKACGALDALQFTYSDGVRIYTSPFYGAAPSLNGSHSQFGDLRGKTTRAMLHGNIRAIDVFWYKHDVTGLAFIGEGGRVIAQEGPGSCRDGFGQRRIQLGQTEKLVGFKFWTDHSTPQISFKIADMGVPQTSEVSPPQQQSMTYENTADNKGLVKTSDIEGPWACCCIPGGFACFEKQAQGPDRLLHKGWVFLFFVLPLPFSEPRIRHANTNGFYKEGEPKNVDTYTSPSCVCNGISCSMKLK